MRLKKLYNTDEEEIFRGINLRVVLQLVVDGALVGAFGGFLAASFRYLLIYFDHLRVDLMGAIDPLSVTVWMLLACLMGFLVHKILSWEPLSGGSGIPQIEGEMMGLFDMNAKKVLLAKYIGGSLTSLGGFSVGREGPSIQVGGATGKIIANLLKRPLRQTRILISAGAGAGLTAAFSAPVSGAIFIFEEVHKSFYPALVIPTFTATLVANLVTSFIFGLGPSLGFTVVGGVPIEYFSYLVLLGVFIGFLGVIVNRSLLFFKKLFLRTYIHGAVKMIFTFITVSIIGYTTVDLLGGGNDLVGRISTGYGMHAISFLLFLLVGKIILTSFCYGSGAQGGIFLPILVIGASGGALFHNLFNVFGMFDNHYLANFSICAMGGILASSVRSPLLSILLVLEMTDSFENTFAVGVVTIVSYVIAEMMKQPPIYDSLLALMIPGRDVTENKQTFFESTISVISPYIGKSLQELSIPEGTLVVSIIRHGEHLVPTADTIIEPHDVLYVSCRRGSLNEAKKYFKGEKEEAK